MALPSVQQHALEPARCCTSLLPPLHSNPTAAATCGRRHLYAATDPLPPARPALEQVWLLATGGEEGVPTFGDAVPAAASGGELVGWVLFDVDATVQWDSADAFAADAAQHCAPPDSPYAFPASGDATVYGWRVVASHRLPEPLPLPAMQRVHRSVYRVAS